MTLIKILQFIIFLSVSLIIIVLGIFKIGSQLKFTFLVNGNKLQGGTHMDLKANDVLPIKVLVEDKFGNPGGALDAPPTFSVDNPQAGAFTVDPNDASGLSGSFTPSGQLGPCNLQVSGAANGNPITGTLALNIIPGDAAQVVIQPGQPVAQ